MKRVPADILESFACDLLSAGGFSAEEASITAKSLILSNLKGYDSHGIVRIRDYIEELKAGNAAGNVGLNVLRETENSIHADAQFGLGQVQMLRFLDRLFVKTEKQAVVSGSLVNCGHAGRLGEWVERAADKGFASFMVVNDNGAYEIVAPAGGIEARTSTNPIAFGIPLKKGQAFTIDLSTSATAAGKMRLAKMAGAQVTKGLLQDHLGNPSTNPACLFEEPSGTILPFGGYKGFALSMMVDCLVAGLSGGYAPPAPPDAKLVNNVVFCLWNPAYFAGLGHMQQEAKKYLDYVRATKPVDANTPVRVPGDRASSEMEQRKKDGIPLEDNFLGALVRYAQSINVPIPDGLKD